MEFTAIGIWIYRLCFNVNGSMTVSKEFNAQKLLFTLVFSTVCCSPLISVLVVYASAFYVYTLEQRWPYYGHPDSYTFAVLGIPSLVTYYSIAISNVATVLVPFVVGLIIGKLSESDKKLCLILTSLFAINYIIVEFLVAFEPLQFGEFIAWLLD